MPKSEVKWGLSPHWSRRPCGFCPNALKGNPEVVFIGKGTSGIASLSPDARALLEKKEVRIIEADTPDMVDEFNELAKTKGVAAIVHVTC